MRARKIEKKCLRAHGETLIKVIIFGSDFKWMERIRWKRDGEREIVLRKWREWRKTYTNLLERDNHGTPFHCCITIAPYFLLSLSKYMSLVINITITLSNKTGEDPKVRTQNVLCYILYVLHALLAVRLPNTLLARKTCPSIPFSLFLICNFLSLPLLMYNVHSTVWTTFFLPFFVHVSQER